MCYYSSTKTDASTLEKKFKRKLKQGEEIKPKFLVSGFAHEKSPIITADEPDLIQNYYWGLIPNFCRTLKDAKDMMIKDLNARSETAFELPSFKNSIDQKRCLILVDGFYEWQKVGKNKYPYFIQLANKEPFAFGGIYNTWVNKDLGEVYNTFSVLTTQASPLMEKIHNTKLRMPLIISKDKENEWIDKGLNKEQIVNLMKPFDENLMQAHTISKLITNRKENANVEGVQKSFKYLELAMFE